MFPSLTHSRGGMHHVLHLPFSRLSQTRAVALTSPRLQVLLADRPPPTWTSHQCFQLNTPSTLLAQTCSSPRILSQLTASHDHSRTGGPAYTAAPAPLRSTQSHRLALHFLHVLVNPPQPRASSPALRAKSGSSPRTAQPFPQWVLASTLFPLMSLYTLGVLWP